MADLVEIAHFYDPEEAYCARGFLQTHGIDTIIQNEHHLNMAPSLRVALGGYRILGVSEQREEAVRVLRKASEAEENTLLPESNQEKTALRKKKCWPWFPIALLAGPPFVPHWKTGPLLLFQLFVLAVIYPLITYSLLSWWR